MPNPYLLPELDKEALEYLWAAVSLADKYATCAEADGLIDEALRIHPKHPRLLGIKAKLYVESALFEEAPDKRSLLEDAKALVTEIKALGVIPWEGCYAGAATEAALSWNWKAADDGFRRANALSPDIAPYCPWNFLFLLSQRRFSDALKLSYRAAERVGEDPVSSSRDLFAHRAIIQASAGQTTHMAESLVTSERFMPSVDVLVGWAILSESVGNRRGALDFLARASAKHTKPDRMILALTACCAAFRGYNEVARIAYDQIVAKDAEPTLKGDALFTYTSSFHLAIAALGLEADRAVDWLIKSATVDRDPSILLVNSFPPFRHLYDNPRFRSLVIDQMHLELHPDANSFNWPKS